MQEKNAVLLTTFFLSIIVLSSGCITNDITDDYTSDKPTFECSTTNGNVDCPKEVMVYMETCTDSIVYTTYSEGEKHYEIMMDFTKDDNVCIVKEIILDMKGFEDEFPLEVSDEMTCHIPISNQEGFAILGQTETVEKYCYGSMADALEEQYKPIKEMKQFCARAHILIQKALYSEGVLTLNLFNTGDVDLEGFIISLEYADGNKLLTGEDDLIIAPLDIKTVNLASGSELIGVEVRSSQCSEVKDSIASHDIEGIGYNSYE